MPKRGPFVARLSQGVPFYAIFPQLSPFHNPHSPLSLKMSSILPPETQILSHRRMASTEALHHRTPRILLLAHQGTASRILCNHRRSFPIVITAASMGNSVEPRSGVYSVGDFMTKKEELHVVKPTTTVDEALEILVEKRITGFPVIDDNWKLVGLVSDYDLLALDSISGGGPTDTGMFPEVDSTWKAFNEVRKLLSKTNGQVVGDVMTPAPVMVRESSNLEDAARILLETKHRRLPVVDSEGKLVGIITRGNVVRAALQIKHQNEIQT